MQRTHYLSVTILLLIFLGGNSAVFSQTSSITGRITGPDQTALPFARVTLHLTNPDSTLVTGGITSENGNFLLQVPDTGNYLLHINFTGYFNKDTLFNYYGGSLDLGDLVLYPDNKVLDAVQVETDATAAIQNGDTTTYNAGAYKVNPDATAQDLVTKIPGVGVVDGEVQAQGEKVTEVLVDGKPFFGSDPNSVLKNVPAEMIDQVQIYDKKSDESMTSGIDDGNTTKSINIITKENYRNGTFGRVYGGYGTEDRYNGGFALNSFTEKHRLSFIGMANNINQQNFSSDDLSGIFNSSNSGSGGRGSEFAGYMNTSNFLISQQDGLSSTYATGLNYVQNWKKTEFTGSYYINLTSNETYKNLDREYFTTETFGSTYNQADTSESSTYTHRFNLKITTKLDSMNTFTFRPSISAKQHNGTSSTSGLNYTGILLTNDLSTLFSTRFGSADITAPLTFTHKFAKKGRSVSAYAEGQYSFNNGNNSLVSQTYSESLLTDSLDQKVNLDQTGYYVKGELSYTEPLGKKASLVVALSQEYTNSFASKLTDSRNDLGEYVLLDSSLSNRYSLNYLATKPTLSYKYQWTKSSLSINAAAQFSELSGNQEFPLAGIIDRHFFAVLPSVQFSYRPARKKGIRINYNTRTQNPEISELQSVLDNTNPIQLKSGNPNLVQEYYHTFSFRYSTTNTDKNTNFMTSANVSSGMNYIGTNSVIAYGDTLVNGVQLRDGMQYKYPVNLDGYWTARMFVSYGRPFKKIKSNGMANLSANYSSRPSMINSVLNKTGSANLRGTLGLGSNISEKIDFNLNSSGSFTWQNSSLTQTTNTYYNQRSQLKFTWQFWKGFVLETDVTHQFYSGLSDGLTTNFVTWNGSFGYKFFKKKSGYLRLTAFDLLNQNSSVSRTITDVYYEDAQSNTINRYFMLEFIYKLSYFKSGSEPTPMPDGPRGPGGPPPGGWGH